MPLVFFIGFGDSAGEFLVGDWGLMVLVGTTFSGFLFKEVSCLDGNS
jgi:hypothetical protein